mgnify:CR=1 FL=1
MSRPDSAGYDPFDTPQPGQGDGYGQGQGFPGAEGFGGGAGYQGSYDYSSNNTYGAPGGQPMAPMGSTAPAVSTGTGLAVTALILGLLSIPLAPVIFGGVLAIAAIIFAIFALRAASPARPFGPVPPGGPPALSLLGLIFSFVGLFIAAFMLWAVWLGVGAVSGCEHLIDDPNAFDACVEDEIFGRLGLN